MSVAEQDAAGMQLDTHIGLAHGNGGRLMRELIDEIFARHLANPDLDVHADAVPLRLEGADVAFATDGFTVKPLEFPGGDIGSLAVHGTCNDLAVAGATPKFLSLNAFIEEGLETERLDRIVRSMAVVAGELHVRIVAGDTKVVPRGEGSGLYLATTGLGVFESDCRPEITAIQPGDVVLVSGPMGDHGTAVMLAREQFGLTGTLRSDAGSVLRLTQALLDLHGLRFLRDPTRGGLAAVAHEIARANAAILGAVQPGRPSVVLETRLGGERFLEELEDDPLPRIC